MERNIIHLGDCLDVLKTLPDNSIDCCVTSPPYYALRDYGIEGQLGLENTPEEYIAKMTEVFMEVYRVLKSEGTLWLNIGDSYNGSGGNNKEHHKNDSGFQGNMGVKCGGKGANMDGLKPKDLIGIPWMLAFSLRSAGWYLRQDIIWAKNNPMPESVTDRCTKSHEYIFLLSKSQKYYFNHEAIQEPAVSSDDLKRRIKNGVEEWKTDKAKDTYAVSGTGRSRTELYSTNEQGDYVRNKRDVWQVNVKPCKEAHFATYPPDLVRPCILAGCPEGGVVLDPFMGSGTTALVAKGIGRDYIGIELNPEYRAIAERRLFDKFGLFL
jgi:DNA modification methylase